MSFLSDLVTAFAPEIASAGASIVGGAVSGVGKAASQFVDDADSFVGSFFEEDYVVDDFEEEMSKSGLFYDQKTSGTSQLFDKAVKAIAGSGEDVAKDAISGMISGSGTQTKRSSSYKQFVDTGIQSTQFASQVFSPGAFTARKANLQDALANVGQSQLIQNMNFVDGNYVKQIADYVMEKDASKPKKGVITQLASASSISPKLAQRLT